MENILLQRWIESRDAEAFRELATRLMPMVYATCARILRDTAEAEDVTQECFESLAGLRGNAPSRLGAWLHRVATNKSLNVLRARSRRSEREQNAILTPDATEADRYDELYAVVDELVAALPDDLRVPLIAHFFENQSHESIARSLGVSRSAVTHRIGRAIDQVRAKLSKKGFELQAVGLGTALEGIRLVPAAVPAGLAQTVSKLAIGGGMAAARGVIAGKSVLAIGGAIITTSQKIIIGFMIATVVIAGSVVGIKQFLRPPENTQVASVSPVAKAESNPQVSAKPKPSLPSTAPEKVAMVSTTPPRNDTDGALATISGIVVDQTGTPAIKVTVQARCAVQAPNSRPPNATTNAFGEFTLVDIPNGKCALFLADQPGTGMSEEPSATVEIKEGKNVTGVRILCGDYGLVISGAVRDSSGKPLSRVHMLTEPPSSGTRTNEKGEYRLRGLVDGKYMVGAFISNDAYMLTSIDQVDAGSSDVDFVLNKSVSVQGRVQDARSGRPISEFSVHTQPKLSVDNIPMFRTQEFVTYEWPQKSDDGNFALDWRLEGSVTMSVTAKGYSNATQEIPITSGTPVTGLVFRLEPAGGMDGVVLTSDGKPAPNVSIFADVVPDPIARKTAALTTSDSDGRFQVELSKSGPQAFAAYDDELGMGRTIFNPETDSGKPISLRLRPFAVVMGRVTRGGTPIERAFVNCGDRHEASGAGATDANGNYRLEHVEPGERTVRLQVGTAARGILPTLFEKGVEVKEGQQLVVDFKVPEESSAVHGRVDVSDEFTASLTMSVENGDFHAMYFVQPTRDGGFTVNEMAAGMVTVRATMRGSSGSAGSQSRTWKFELAPGEHAEKEFSFVAGDKLAIHLDGTLTEQFYGTILLLPSNIAFRPEDWNQLLKGASASVQMRGTATDIEMGGIEPGAYTAILRYANDDSNNWQFAKKDVEIGSGLNSTIQFDVH